MESSAQTATVYKRRAFAGYLDSALSLRLNERRLLLSAADLTALNLGLVLSILLIFSLRLFGADYIGGLTEELFRLQVGGSPLLWGILLSLLWYPIASAFGCYETEATVDVRVSLFSSSRAVLVTLAAFVLLPYATPFLVSRSVLFTLVGIVSAAVVAVRTITIVLMGRPRFQRRTLVVGAGQAGRTLLQALACVPKPIYEVVGFLDDDESKLGKMIVSKLGRGANPDGDGPRVIGTRHDLQRLIEAKRISTIVLAITHRIDAELMQILLGCLEYRIEIIPMPALYEQVTGRVPVEHVGDHWYVTMPITHRGISPIHSLVKRVLDIFLSLIGLLLLAPLLPLIALAIYIDSPGPIFYGQVRLGRAGRPFVAWKFRSMRVDAERGEAVWAARGDSRVTRVGRFLRRTHIDELPQFWNIFKGEMSTVGPRPERPEFVEQLEKSIPFYRTRLMVKPGMAGWGLVKQGYTASSHDALIKLQYDLYYIKHQSIFLDVVILLKTAIDMISFRGR